MIDAKAYLRQVRLSDIHINNKIEDLASLRELATKVTTNMKPEGSSGSGNQDKLGSIVAKIVCLENEIDESIDEYIDLKRAIGATIENVKDAEQVQVLHKRYFEYKTWELIACEMNMTCRNVCYIHGRALQAVTQILKEG